MSAGRALVIILVIIAVLLLLGALYGMPVGGSGGVDVENY